MEAKILKDGEDASEVLILVLVEVVLGVISDIEDGVKKTGLNPCFSGSCSWRKLPHKLQRYYNVLILVLVEVVLGESLGLTQSTMRRRLNPCFSGSCSWRYLKNLPLMLVLYRLNPCFSGSCSWSLQHNFRRRV